VLLQHQPLLLSVNQVMTQSQLGLAKLLTCRLNVRNNCSNADAGFHMALKVMATTHTSANMLETLPAPVGASCYPIN
jgi:hypothetical protein